MTESSSLAPLHLEEGDQAYSKEDKSQIYPKTLAGTKKLIKELTTQAKQMRSNPTRVENKLWNLLRNNSLGFKFRRQHIIDKFIVDFVCLDRNLIIEVDGEIHNYQKEAVEERERILNSIGYKFLRFRNEEVLNSINDVKKVICSVLELSSPQEQRNQAIEISVNNLSLKPKSQTLLQLGEEPRRVEEVRITT